MRHKKRKKYSRLYFSQKKNIIKEYSNLLFFKKKIVIKKKIFHLLKRKINLKKKKIFWFKLCPRKGDKSEIVTVYLK